MSINSYRRKLLQLVACSPVLLLSAKQIFHLLIPNINHCPYLALRL
ncbi:MAG: hypothetical protein ISR69_04420 [Gammaproteobacteria bacterium]|nr:hypothetical protein [Gammaproteobacteria bacterium]